jgi:hypothetical protein
MRAMLDNLVATLPQAPPAARDGRFVHATSI